MRLSSQIPMFMKRVICLSVHSQLAYEIDQDADEQNSYLDGMVRLGTILTGFYSYSVNNKQGGREVRNQ